MQSNLALKRDDEEFSAAPCAPTEHVAISVALDVAAWQFGAAALLSDNTSEARIAAQMGFATLVAPCVEYFQTAEYRRFCVWQRDGGDEPPTLADPRTRELFGKCAVLLKDCAVVPEKIRAEVCDALNEVEEVGAAPLCILVGFCSVLANTLRGQR